MQKCLQQEHSQFLIIGGVSVIKRKSTTGALLIAVDNNIAWHRLLEAGNDVRAVFFNHRKVFDGECLTKLKSMLTHTVSR